MNEQVFWNIVESTSAIESLEERIQAIGSLLNGKEDVQSLNKFHRIHQRLRNKGLEYDLWAAAYVLMEDSSFSSFEVFINWLILQGQSTYKKAIDDPETLLPYIGYFKKANLSEMMSSLSNLNDLAENIYSERYRLSDFQDQYPFECVVPELKGEPWSLSEEVNDRVPLLCYHKGWLSEVPTGNWVSDV